jgi:protein-disulfide isomerase
VERAEQGKERGKVRIPRRAIVPVLALAWLEPGSALGQEVGADPLRQEIQELREEIRALKAELREVKSLLRGRPAPAAPAVPAPAAPAPAPLAPPRTPEVDLGDNPAKGKAGAPVTLVEFSDFQCPFCARYVRDTYPEIVREYVETGKLRYVFMDLPLESIHRLAFRAAEAAHCAGEQDRYWEMHDRLFENQRRLEPWAAHAQALEMDVTRFEECLAAGRHAASVRRDMEEARKAGVNSTPVFLLGRTDPAGSRLRASVVLRGAYSLARFQAEIERLLESAGPATAR